VQAAGFASVVPMGGAPDSTVIRIPEHPTSRRSEQPYANYSFASPGYFATISTPFERGRDFTDADTLQSLHVTIINTSMAEKYFPGEDPIGKQVGVAATRFPVRTIIGVVADIKQASLREEPAPEMFVPYTQSEIKAWPSMQSMQFVLRSKAENASLLGSVRQAVGAVDSDLPIAKFATLSAMIDSSMTTDRFSMLLVSSFGVIALLLASIGMYGVISYSVLQRTPEIGIRLALGAGRVQILVIILCRAAYLAFAGIAVGLLGALASTRLITRFLYGVESADPLTFALVSLLLLAVALSASYVPARKAMQTDPMVAVRYE
jgi:putative ABC transport system permease protein